MKNNLVALISGLIFAVGLGISGMTQSARVVGFLNIFGRWDPSLAFVMIGAIAVHFFAYRIAGKKRTPLFAEVWHIPKRRDITATLIVGAFIFGIGWGLAGYCPGPAITSLGTLQSRPLVFVASLVVGMIFYRIFENWIGLRQQNRMEQKRLRTGTVSLDL